MNKALTIVFALFAGLVGGLLTRYIAPSTALAQSQMPVTKEIRAERFTLVDGMDRTVGMFVVKGNPLLDASPQIRRIRPEMRTRTLTRRRCKPKQGRSGKRR